MTRNDSHDSPVAMYDVDVHSDLIRFHDEEALKFISLHRTNFQSNGFVVCVEDADKDRPR